jgi:hypothetical protein
MLLSVVSRCNHSKNSQCACHKAIQCVELRKSPAETVEMASAATKKKIAFAILLKSLRGLPEEFLLRDWRLGGCP